MGGAVCCYVHVRTPGQASGFFPPGCDPGIRCALWWPWPVLNAEWRADDTKPVEPHSDHFWTSQLPSPSPSPLKDHPSSVAPPVFQHMLSGSSWWGHWPANKVIPRESRFHWLRLTASGNVGFSLIPQIYSLCLHLRWSYLSQQSFQWFSAIEGHWLCYYYFITSVRWCYYSIYSLYRNTTTWSATNTVMFKSGVWIFRYVGLAQI